MALATQQRRVGDFMGIGLAQRGPRAQSGTGPSRAATLMKQTSRPFAAVAALSACLVAPSCIGPDNLYRGVSAWNSNISDSKYVNEILFLGLHILPVYPIAMVGDRLVFNSIEFWWGKNPIGKPDEFKPQETASN
jgi:hypothetical protein